MKSKEKILRYLSGLMTDVEKKSFLNEFENSVELRNQFEKINGKLNELNIKSDQLLDETYFIYLLSKVRTKIN